VNPAQVVTQFVATARRRFLCNEAIAQTVFAASLAAGGIILLLLVGTQILDWRWLVPLAAGGVGSGVWRAARRMPSHYRVAQMVDRRAGLYDAVSTAVAFSGGGRNADESVRLAQLNSAVRSIAGVPIEIAMPFALPRSVYTAGFLAAAALSLFALRYGFARRLDLERPITSVLFDPYGANETRRAAAKNRLPKAPNLRELVGVPLDLAEDGDPAKLDSAPDNVLDTIDVPDVNSDAENAVDGKTKPGARAQGENPEDNPPGESVEEGEAGSGSDGSAEQNSDKSGKQSDKNSKTSGPGSNESNSLLSKLRDAMNNMMSRMKQPGGDSAEKQQGKGQASEGQNQKGNSGQKGQQGQGKQAGGQQSADAQDGQEGDSSENANNSEGKSGGKSSDSDSVNAAGSGVGKQDGAKDVKLAEQAAAMGKISEIIGKRSQNVSGEVTVEVQSSKQGLRTPYAPGQAAPHADAGGEISRDEVPVALQPFVEQYFEQVRKQESAAAKGSSGTRSKPASPGR
jgi:hypothetical protein